MKLLPWKLDKIGIEWTSLRDFRTTISTISAIQFQGSINLNINVASALLERCRTCPTRCGPKETRASDFFIQTQFLSPPNRTSTLPAFTSFVLFL